MKWLEYIKLFTGLLPLLMTLIQAVEAQLPQAGAGALKLQLVLDTIKASHDFADTAEAEWDRLKPSITSIINSAVSVFNSIKVFRK